MHLPSFNYLRPKHLNDALKMLGESHGRAAILAGGTDLMASMGQRLIVPERVISIRDLSELRGVAIASDGSVRIGAGTTLTSLAEDAGLADVLPILSKAIRSVASVHVRNMATLGGNLALPTRCWFTNQTESWRNARAGCYKTDKDACHVLASSARCVATSSADSVPALIVLDAVLTLASQRGLREIELAKFYRDDGVLPTVLHADELITEIHVPACADRTAFMKVTPREGIDFGLGNIAARVTGGNRKPAGVRIVVNALGVKPMRLRSAEAAILEEGLSDSGIENATRVARTDLGEITNLWSPAGYKRRLVRVMLRRILHEIREQEPSERPRS